MPDSAFNWSRLETSQTPMHQGVLLTFARPNKAPRDFVARLARELRQTTDVGAGWRQDGGLLQAPDWLRPPWAEEAGLELDYHFRHSGLPSPGGERELGELISRLHGHPLAPERPGWEIHLIEGLHGNRFAVYAKCDPALLRGRDIVGLMTGWLQPRAADRTLVAPWSQSLDGNGDGAGSETAIGEAPSAAALSEAGAEGGEARRLRKALRRLAGSALRSTSPLRAPYRAPRSALNVRVGTQRRIATQQYALDRLNALAAACEVDLEHLVLYLCGSVLRRFFREYNALPDASLVAACLGTQRLREAQGHVAGEGLGPMALVSLGTHRADMDKRLAAVGVSLQASREHLAPLDATSAARYNAALTVPLLLDRVPVAGRVLPPLANVPIFALSGPPRRRYLRGAALEAVYPLFPLLQEHALSISLCTYADTLNVGFHGEREALPHLQRMAVYMGVALEELENARLGGGS